MTQERDVMAATAPTTQPKTKFSNIIRFAGAFVAFMIGSGYATGQEIMQFFTAYGYWALGGALIAMVLFSWSGKVFMNYGFRHRDVPKEGASTKAFEYYTGKMLGTFLQWFIPIFLFMVVVVMISGAGATIAQYFGVPQIVGSALMAILAYVVNLFGLKRVVDIIGFIGPVAIVFTVLVALYAIVTNPSGLANVPQHAELLAEMPKATSNPNFWWLAGLLYVAYNVTGSIPFFTETGKMADTATEAKVGAVLGGILLMLAAGLLVVAHLAYLPQIASLEVPNLFLTDLISPAISFLFVIVLLGGIFSTAAPMLWIATSRIANEGSKQYRIALTILAIIALIGGQLPFGKLVGTVYPFTGYLGIVVLICVLVRQIIEMKNRKAGLPEETPLKK